MSEVGDYLFMPKETGHDPVIWYVGMEPRASNVSIFESHYLAIELKEPTYENAQALAEYLNENVANLRVSKLPGKGGRL